MKTESEVDKCQIVYNLKHIFDVVYNCCLQQLFSELVKREKNHLDLVLGQGQDLLQNTVIK